MIGDKIEAKIEIKGDIIDTIFVGNIVSIDIDAISNTGTFEISHLGQVQPKKEEKSAKDYIETDGKTFWKMDIGSYIDDLIQEKIKEIKLDD